MDINEYGLYNKDKLVATFDEYISNLITYDRLPYGFNRIGTWVERRYKFSCVRDPRTFLMSIGINSPLDFIDMIHGVSLHDTYWLKRLNDNTKWEDISPYTHEFSEAVSTYALDGIQRLSSTKNYYSPVMETNGSFPHTWLKKNNEIYFVKAGSKYKMPASNSGMEPYSEYYASLIARYLGFNAVDYTLRNHKRYDGKIDVVTECKIYTDEITGTIPAKELGLETYEDVISYCKKLSEDSYKTIIDMLFLDCLLMNVDRHFRNIEFFVNNETQEVLGLVPIFDNNNSMLPRFVEGYDSLINLDREVYKVRDGRTFEELYTLVNKHKNYRNELLKLKNLYLEKPKNVEITDARIKFLNDFLQMQVEYLLKN